MRQQEAKVADERGDEEDTDEVEVELKVMQAQATAAWASIVAKDRLRQEPKPAPAPRAPLASVDGYLEAADTFPHPAIPDTESPYFGHLPEACWRMVVKFPRRR